MNARVVSVNILLLLVFELATGFGSFGFFEDFDDDDDDDFGSFGFFGRDLDGFRSLGVDNEFESEEVDLEFAVENTGDYAI